MAMARFLPAGDKERRNENKTGLLECKFYDSNCATTECGTTHCQPRDPHDPFQPICHAEWTEDTNGNEKLSFAGCLPVQVPGPMNCDVPECIDRRGGGKRSQNETTFSCCCQKSLCNEYRSYVSTSSRTLPTTTYRIPEKHAYTQSNQYTTPIVYSFFIILAVASLIIFWSWFIWRRNGLKKAKKSNDHVPVKTCIGNRESMDLANLPIHLIEIIGQGRFGNIWKARIGQDKLVAIKAFQRDDIGSRSWAQELDIFETPMMKDHPNILNFIAAEVKETQYWIITAYHEHGSLYDFLKRHTLTLPEAVRVSISVLRGLSFLHEQYFDEKTLAKPTIVHRDLKSKNILMKSDMSACIADFGLAVKFYDSGTPEDALCQAGTDRYMAPEVLERATDLTAAAFRHIDVYACALVLWEIISRCNFSGEPVDDYRLPFDEELQGSKPSIEIMSKLVCTEKRRPTLNESWLRNPHGYMICSTIREMWDEEQEARLSASCALSRFIPLSTEAVNSNVEIVIPSDDAPLMAPV